MEKQFKKQLVTVGAKVPPEIRELLEKKAKKEERSMSQIISRLLSSHPDLQGKKTLALQN